MRKKYEEGFKVKVALAALQDGAKVNEVAAKYDVHPNKVMEWRKCRFRTKKTRNSGAKRPDFPVHEDQDFRSKKTNLSTFSGFNCMTA